MSVTVYPRSAWTSTAPGFPRYSGRKITPSQVTHLRLHYPGDGNHTRAHYTRAQSEQALRNYRSFHVNTRRWADIGYPLAVDQSGRAWVAAGTTHAAAHSATGARPNENWHSLAILLIIGNNERPSAAMIATVNAIWAGLLDGSLGLGRFPNMRTVTAHNDVPGASTRCAGPQVDALLRQGAFDASKATRTPTTGEDWLSMPSNEDLEKIARAVWSYRNDKLETSDAYMILRRIRDRAQETRDLVAEIHTGDNRIRLTGAAASMFDDTWRAGALDGYAAMGGFQTEDRLITALAKELDTSTDTILAAISRVLEDDDGDGSGVEHL